MLNTTGAKLVLIQDKSTVQFQQDLGVERDKYCEELVTQKIIYTYCRSCMQWISVFIGIFIEMVNKNTEVILS